MAEKFKGFILPKTNFFRMPNEWTDITHDIKSLAELKVIEYVLRHTWGYNGQEGMPKRISTDEFANGRKRKNGDRMDMGTGLSVPSIIDGLRRAVEHGYLNVDEDKTDLGRIKRHYSLKMFPGRPIDASDQDKESLEHSKEPLDRTKKDNRGKTNKGKTREGGDRRSPTPLSRVYSTNGRTEKSPLSSFDKKAAAHLRTLLNEHNVLRLKSAKIETLGKQVLRLRSEGVEKKKIREVFEWWSEHYDEEFVPKMRKATDVFDKFDGVVEQMKFRQESNGRSNGRRITRDNMWDEENCPNGHPEVWIGLDGKRYDGDLMNKLGRMYSREFGPGRPDQEEVDVLLKKLGKRAGSVPAAALEAL